MLYKKLHPDIEFGSRKYTMLGKDNCENELPIIQLFDDWKSNYLMILGEGSMGKSTALKILEAELVYREIPSKLIECRKIDRDYDIEKVISNLPKNTVFLIDALDENYRDEIIKIIKKVKEKYRVVITSRYHPLKNILGSNESDKTLSKDNPEYEKQLTFAEFEVATLCPLSENHISELIGDNVIKESKCFELLSNTMFLVLALKISENPIFKHKIKDIEDEVSFLQLYFESLFQEKNKNGKLAVNSSLEKIGEAIYDCIIIGSCKEVINDWTEINGIFTFERTSDGRYTVESHQLRYSDFALAKYLFTLVNGFINNDFIKEKLEHVISKRALVYLGKMIKDTSEGKAIMQKLNEFPKSDTLCYQNLLYVFLGYNDGVIDDVEENGVFDVGKNFYKIALKLEFFKNNEHIKAFKTVKIINKFKMPLYFTSMKNTVAVGCEFDVIIPDSVRQLKEYCFYDLSYCIKNITIGENVTKIEKDFFGTGERILKNIYVHPKNKTFVAINNCLIDKNKKTLHLCGENPKIPNYVKTIEEGALSSETKIYLPKTVKKIRRQRDGYVGIDEDLSTYFISSYEDKYYFSSNITNEEKKNYLFYKNNSVTAHLGILSADEIANSIDVLIEKNLETKGKYSIYEEFAEFDLEDFDKYLYRNNGEKMMFLMLGAECKNGIDFDDVSKNIYSYWYSMKFNSKIVDRFILINGLPVVNIKIVDEEKSLKKAYEHFRKEYKKREDKFTYTQIIVLTNGKKTKIGKKNYRYDEYIDYSIDEKSYSPNLMNIDSGLCSIGIAIKYLFNKESLIHLVKLLSENVTLSKVIEENLSLIDEKYLENRKADEKRAKKYASIKEKTKSLLRKNNKEIKRKSWIAFWIAVVLLIGFQLVDMNNTYISLFNSNKLYFIVYVVFSLLVFCAFGYYIRHTYICIMLKGKRKTHIFDLEMTDVLLEVQQDLKKDGYDLFIPSNPTESYNIKI